MSRKLGVTLTLVGLLLFGALAWPRAAYVKARGGGVSLAAQDTRVTRRPPGYPIYQGGFEVEVLVDGYPLEAMYGRGRRYVEAIAGEEYEVRVRNPLPVRVAVALSVDGLNTIDARHTASWDASKWVIEPYGTIRVGGWQMSSARARRFYFTTERDSYAARLGRKADLGVITAVFYREREHYTVVPAPVTPRPRDDDRSEPLYDGRSDSRSESRKSAPPPPRGESAGRSSAQTQRGADEYAATGIGRSVENHVNWIRMDLDRRPAAEISIRYEYREALYRLGLRPRPRPDDDTLRRRERSRGFEDSRYSPEP